jgi:hypothetical protein
MRDWCGRDDFFFLLPQLLRGEDAAFAAHLQQVANDVRGAQFLVRA